MKTLESHGHTVAMARGGLEAVLPANNDIRKQVSPRHAKGETGEASTFSVRAVVVLNKLAGRLRSYLGEHGIVKPLAAMRTIANPVIAVFSPRVKDSKRGGVTEYFNLGVQRVAREGRAQQPASAEVEQEMVHFVASNWSIA